MDAPKRTGETWLRAQLEELVRAITPCAKLDKASQDEFAIGRGYGYEHLLAGVKDILDGRPYADFRWDPDRHDLGKTTMKS